MEALSNLILLMCIILFALIVFSPALAADIIIFFVKKEKKGGTVAGTKAGILPYETKSNNEMIKDFYERMRILALKHFYLNKNFTLFSKLKSNKSKFRGKRLNTLKVLSSNEVLDSEESLI